jgi:hypothetical protein
MGPENEFTDSSRSYEHRLGNTGRSSRKGSGDPADRVDLAKSPQRMRRYEETWLNMVELTSTERTEKRPAFSAVASWQGIIKRRHVGAENQKVPLKPLQEPAQGPRLAGHLHPRLKGAMAWSAIVNTVGWRNGLNRLWLAVLT